jgi:hypothetical protein
MLFPSSQSLLFGAIISIPSIFVQAKVRLPGSVLSVSPPAASQSASPNTVASSHLTLTRHAPSATPNSKRDVNARSGPKNDPLSVFEKGSLYSTEIKLGSQYFNVQVDTGSADLWVAETGFQCEGSGGIALPQIECGIQQTYNIDQSFSPLNETFNITYAAGAASGVIGYEVVELAGITVNQIIGAVQLTVPSLDGVISGILGLLAYDIA